MSIKVAKNDFTRKLIDFDTFTKIANNVCDLGKIIASNGFERSPKVQKIAQSGHTESDTKIWCVNKPQVPSRKIQVHCQSSKLPLSV